MSKMSSSSRRKKLPDNAPRPRHCTVTKTPSFDGYGFNLHAEKARPGQFIGKVDPGSPAEAAGMKEGDRIVEVNGVNISHENHKQVVQRIKAVEDETRLLLIDNEVEAYYKQNDVVIHGEMENVLYLCSSNSREIRRNSSNVAAPVAAAASRNSMECDYDQAMMSDDHSGDHGGDHERRSNGSGISASNNANHATNSGANSADHDDVNNKKAFASSSTSGSSPRSTPSPEPPVGNTSLRPVDLAGLNLNMSAKEMRARIGSKKKRDPRKDDRMDFKEKFDILDSL